MILERPDITENTMGIPNHNLDDLEQRRLALEDNITQLQKSLYHWRTWEAEYDSLREEIKDLQDYATADDILAVARQYEGSLVNEKEIQTILRTEVGVTRSRTQVVDLLGRRIDYVKQNAATMEKRLRGAENELYTLDSNDQLPADISGDQGFPMSEIIEELDDEGNVISSSVNTPGDHAPAILEALKKAGVDDIPEISTSSENVAGSSSATREEKEDAVDAVETNEKSEVVSNGHTSTTNANDVSQEVELNLLQPVSLVTPEDRNQPPVTDIDEPADEATLRREMLEYGIHEVGAIVAELELDEEGSEFSISDEEFDVGTEEEDEDEYGRSHLVLSEEYHRQMRELEAKLNARGMTNLGKDTQTFPEEVRQEIENSTTEPTQETEPAQENGEIDSSAKGKKPKKKVAFADDLDIAPAAAAAAAEKKATPPPKPKPQASVQVLSDSIVERTEQPKEPRPAPSTGPKKVSRFKTARVVEPAASTTAKPASSQLPPHISESQTSRKQANAVPPPGLFPATPREPKPFSTPIMDIPTGPSAPNPPEGKTLADKLVERNIAPSSITAPEPDELDEEIHRREIASEFYRMRNSKIQQQGGFVNEEEPEFVPVEEPAERVSRFKAARVRP
jgi:unconventional prefoldin RPB5 interactor 1